MTLTQVVTLVKLKSDEYSVPQDSLGFIKEVWPEDAKEWSDIAHVAVAWTENPGVGGGSAPIILDDLEILGQIYVPISDEVVKAKIEEAKIDVPDWLVRQRAKQMIKDVMKKLET